MIEMRSPCLNCTLSRAGCLVRTICPEHQAYEEYMHRVEYPARAMRSGIKADYYEHLADTYRRVTATNRRPIWRAN